MWPFLAGKRGLTRSDKCLAFQTTAALGTNEADLTVRRTPRIPGGILILEVFALSRVPETLAFGTATLRKPF